MRYGKLFTGLAFSLLTSSLYAGHPLLAPDKLASGKICTSWLEQRPLTKMVVAINPNAGDVDYVVSLIKLGTDVFRLNLSHIPLADAIAAIEKITAASEKANRPVGILYDLPGPKLRIGQLPSESVFTLNGEETLILTPADAIGEANFRRPNALQLPLPQWIFNELVSPAGPLKVGDRVMFDDGKLEANVVSLSLSRVELKIVRAAQSFALRSRLGIDFPDTDLKIPVLQMKDRDAILAALISGKVHKIALSFVREASDIKEARALVRKYLALLTEVKRLGVTHKFDADTIVALKKMMPSTAIAPTDREAKEWLVVKLRGVILREPQIDAKIERREAVVGIDEIMDEADGVMVARGDLIMAVGSQNLLLAQARIVKSAQQRGKPVIIATGLLSGMSNGVMSHSSAVDVGLVAMLYADAAQLSNESVIGDPFVAIPLLRLHLVGGEIAAFESLLITDTVAVAPTVRFSRNPSIALSSGPTKLHQEHFVFTNDPYVAGLLCFRRGVRPMLIGGAPPLNATIQWYQEQLKAKGEVVQSFTLAY